MTDTHTIMGISKGTEEDRLFDGAFNSVMYMDKKDFPNYVGGLMIASGDDFPITSPIDQSIIFGRFQEPEDGLTDRAVEVAVKAFETWSKTDAAKRAEIFGSILDTVRKQRFRLAAAVTVSVGMVRREALGEVDRLIEVLEKACSDVLTANGKPMGAWAVLSSHNSPLASPIGYSVAAMIAGNTVVLMPSRYAPLPTYMLYDIFVAAGVPDGVFNLIVDRRNKSTNDLANNPDLAGIVATGSGDRMEDLMFLQADDELGFINEIKGMNPIMVYKAGNIKEVAKTVIEAAFSYSGQRLDSCSKVVVTAEEQKPFMDALIAEAKKMVVGDPADLETFTGPIISEAHLDKFLQTVKSVRDNLIFGGRQMKDEVTEAGFYVIPAIVMGLTEDDDLNNIDSALPILSVQIAESAEDAIDDINSSEYGLSAGIISKDDTVTEKFRNAIQADQVFVNDRNGIKVVASRAKVSNFIRK